MDGGLQAAEVLPGKWLCIITGSSRGLGRSLAMVLAPRLPPASRLVLVARDAGCLLRLERQLPAGRLRVSRVQADLSGEEGQRRLLSAVSSAQELDEPPDRLLLINNA
ncbi:hypothetical protein scyTo_0024162, partial [Scyliorhinus torazame]|nr:hypothetical protein [Scyliorhinus torazame]